MTEPERKDGHRLMVRLPASLSAAVGKAAMGIGGRYGELGLLPRGGTPSAAGQWRMGGVERWKVETVLDHELRALGEVATR